MKKTLALLEYPKGPVLVDYPVDCDKHSETDAPLACPVNFQTRPEAVSSLDKILEEFRGELSTMQTWYDQAGAASGKVSAGASGLASAQIVDLFAQFINNNVDTNEIHGQNVADLLRLAAEDLKAFYFKAVSAQPGQSTDVVVLADWFWGDTYAAACINEVRKACLKREAKEFQLAGKLLLIPRSQMHRFE